MCEINFLSDSLRPSSPVCQHSPRPSSPGRPSTPRKVIPIPTAGRSSRPSSARSVSSNRNGENSFNFTVRDFKHFCWDDEVIFIQYFNVAVRIQLCLFRELGVGF